MRAEREDQLSFEKGRKRRPTATLIIVGAVVLGLVFWFWSGDDADVPGEAEQSAIPVAETPPAPLPPAPDIPRRPEPAPEPEPDAEPVAQEPPAAPAPPPLPSPEESDSLLLAALAEVGLGQSSQRLKSEQPLQDSAALVDAAGRGYLLRKHLDTGVEGAFAVEKTGGQIFMAEEGYRRYDDIARSLASIDTAVAVERFHSLRPLFERAYDKLGMDTDDFDNAVIRTLDQVLATPVIDEPIALQRKSVLYTYADPELEGLTGLQKQLLRMGPENLRRIKEQARRLRAGLLAE